MGSTSTCECCGTSVPASPTDGVALCAKCAGMTTDERETLRLVRMAPAWIVDLVEMIGETSVRNLTIKFLIRAIHRASEQSPLRLAVIKHHAARGHERCWQNDAELYVAAGLEPPESLSLPPREEFRQRCQEYEAGQYGATAGDVTTPASKVRLQHKHSGEIMEVEEIKGRGYIFPGVAPIVSYLAGEMEQWKVLPTTAGEGPSERDVLHGGRRESTRAGLSPPSIHLNDFVKVRLTDHGRKMMRRDHAMVISGRIDYEDPKEDAEGWSRWQLWHLMSMLGKYCVLGGPEPIRAEIRIECKQDDATSVDEVDGQFEQLRERLAAMPVSPEQEDRARRWVEAISRIAPSAAVISHLNVHAAPDPTEIDRLKAECAAKHLVLQSLRWSGLVIQKPTHYSACPVCKARGRMFGDPEHFDGCAYELVMRSNAGAPLLDTMERLRSRLRLIADSPLVDRAGDDDYPERALHRAREIASNAEEG